MTCAKILEQGGGVYTRVQDSGFTPGHSFQDQNWHIWQLVHVDLAHINA